MRTEDMNAVEIICLEDLGECLHDSSILITVCLHLINQGNFDLGPFAEWLKNGGEFLFSMRR